MDVQQTRQEVVVGAERLPGGALRAHALPDLGPSTATYGTAHCGFPAEALTLVPDLAWESVEPASRCPHCRDGG